MTVTVDGTDGITFPDLSLQAVASGPHAMEFISTIDISGESTIEFTGFDATRYDSYEFVIQNVIPGDDDRIFQLRTSTDGGTGYDSGGTDYVYSAINVGNTTAGDVESAGDSVIELFARIGSSAGEDGISGIVNISGPHLTKQTISNWLLTGTDRDGAGKISVYVGGGYRDSAADVDAIQFKFHAGTLESGTITFYGIRNST